MKDLGTLGGKCGFGFDINDNGQVVGTAQTQDGFWHGFLWQKEKMIDLGTFRKKDISKKDIVMPFAINESGQVVGEIANDSLVNQLLQRQWGHRFLTMPDCLHRGIGSNFAFIWESGVMKDLNSLIPVGSDWVLVSASDINDKGQIIATGVSKTKRTIGVLFLNPISKSSAKLVFGAETSRELPLSKPRN